MNFDVVQHDMKDISKHLSINYKTVASFLYRIRDYGEREIGKCWNMPKPKPVGNENVENLLLSDELLTKWSPYTMRARALKIKKRFNVEIDHSRLRRFYLRN